MTTLMLRAVSVVLIVAMASLPLGGVVCGIRCLSAADPATGHGEHAGTHGHEEHAQAQEPITDAAWRAVTQGAGHECGDHPGTLREALTRPVTKIADGGLCTLVCAKSTMAGPDVTAVSRLSVRGHSPPDSGALAPRTSLVLRI